jgi:DNA-binding NtrC family response regulator
MRHDRCSSQKILIVEDDPLLKLLTLDIVAEAGFDVLGADNADEAISMLERRADIVMLLTDINMPGSMDGLKLSHVAHSRWPHIKIVVVSGRADVSVADLPVDGHFFRKPYHADAMISAIQSLIDPAHQSATVYLDV